MSGGFGPRVWSGVATCLLTSGLCSTATAQQPPKLCRPDDAAYVVSAWNTEQGLPQSTVTSIAQTPDGYLWLGTLGGLARFDGNRFRVFTNADGLPSQRVLSLLVAGDGTLWIGTEGSGVARYANGVFTAFSTNHGLSNPVIFQIAQDRAGRIWFGTQSGFSVFHDNRFTAIRHANGMEIAVVTGLTIGTAGEVWGATSTHLCRMDDLTPRCERLPAAIVPNNLLARGPDELWIGTASEGVVRKVQGQLLTFPDCAGPACVLGREVWALATGHPDDVWIGTDRGLSRQRNKRFSHYTAPTALPSARIRSLLEDREGNVWVGTTDAGLLRLKSSRLTVCGTAEGLPPQVPTAVAEDRNGSLWVGSNCGGTHVLHAGAVESLASAHRDPDPTRCVFSIGPSRDGGLWMGTWGTGVLKVNGRTLSREKPLEPLSKATVLSVHEDAKGGVWFGTYEGGLHYLHDGQLHTFTTADGIAGTYHTAIVEQADGTIWVGSNRGGLTRFKDGRFTPFRRADGVGSDAVRALFVDRADTLWIGTGDAGLVRRRDERFVRYDVGHGLADNNVAQILEDAQGDLWIGSGYGISRLRRQELDDVAEGRLAALNVLTLGSGDGLARPEAVGDHSPSAWRARDGRVWFATYSGLVVIDPGRIRFNDLPPPVAIEDVAIDGVRNEPAERLRVAPGARSLQIRYTALSLVDPPRNRFRYRLLDWDRRWIEAGTDRTAVYGNIPPGRYEFVVEGANSDGTWNRRGARMVIDVEPYLWERWWFQPLIGLALVAGLAGGLRMAANARVRRELQVLEQERALVQERARIARDMHDELGARLTNAAMLADAASPDPHVRQLSDALRSAVQAMDQTVWTVNPRHDSLESFTSYVSRYAHEYLGAASIRCHLEVPISLPKVTLAAAVRHELLMVIKESLTNIVRHAGATQAWFRLRLDAQGALRIEVSDDGCGFDVQVASARHGVGNMHERMRSVGGTLDVRSGAEGTVVTLTLRTLKGQATGSYTSM